MDDMKFHSYHYFYCTTHELPVTLSDLHAAGMYAWSSQSMIKAGPERSLHPTPSLSYLLQVNDALTIDLNGSFGTLVAIRSFYVSFYTCTNIWLTFDHKTDDKHPLYALDLAHSDHLDDSFCIHQSTTSVVLSTSQLC